MLPVEEKRATCSPSKSVGVAKLLEIVVTPSPPPDKAEAEVIWSPLVKPIIGPCHHGFRYTVCNGTHAHIAQVCIAGVGNTRPHPRAVAVIGVDVSHISKVQLGERTNGIVGEQRPRAASCRAQQHKAISISCIAVYGVVYIWVELDAVLIFGKEIYMLGLGGFEAEVLRIGSS